MAKPNVMDSDLVERHRAIGGMKFSYYLLQTSIILFLRCWCKNGYKRNAQKECVQFCSVIATKIPVEATAVEKKVLNETAPPAVIEMIAVERKNVTEISP